ncbi:bifunctional 4-hydroxy-2-oxoglutarate aldolase/2-dehydro-3-deoxy-phosphogluconate aldolase [Microbacterium sp. G2-8]|uniref:bifunctional 4-hydroxy-2-oxoglutarate aldolase/2-dehydro-3-deoxy-phosphogluconate aldolase n=1 Tax=Microbacterium sp. G2-8 TaxID=2842454 RepID=UPI001C8915C3|nr:bifunctional 4-hydroxy-2-oxoglutarate aldolase/2-dehydro-3-deoxy-phosphogluconate aldolase [Microbacterium sp. G2-8]
MSHALFDHPVIPLASVKSADHIEAIGDGLVAGGLPVVEVGLRTEHGLPAIERLAARGDLLVGAGTVLDPAQARRAIDAGAQFVVTPGFDGEVVDLVRAAGMPIVPGVVTPTEVQQALRAGLDRLKLFPASVVGGLDLLTAYADIYRGVRFMPSGGVSLDTLAETLAHPLVFAASGSWITKHASDGAEAVATAARRALEVARSAS